MSERKNPGAAGTARGAGGDDLASKRVNHEYSKLLLKEKPQFVIRCKRGGQLEVSTIEGSFTLDALPEDYGEFAQTCKSILGRPPATWVERAWPGIKRMLRP